MNVRSSSIIADILHFISDGKFHTLQEIADEVEVSRITAYRHIQSLSYRYNIESFHGGDLQEWKDGYLTKKSVLKNLHLMICNSS